MMPLALPPETRGGIWICCHRCRVLAWVDDLPLEVMRVCASGHETTRVTMEEAAALRASRADRDTKREAQVWKSIADDAS